MLVLGGLLNKLLPVKLGIRIQSQLGSWVNSCTNSAGRSPSESNKGQNGADGQQGAIRVPVTFVFLVCCISLGINPTGGHHQLFSFPQSTVKVSTASVSGVQSLELNHSTCLLCELANLSIEWGPQR